MKTFRAFGPTIGKTKLSKKIINIPFQKPSIYWAFCFKVINILRLSYHLLAKMHFLTQKKIFFLHNYLRNYIKTVYCEAWLVFYFLN